jgi:hypothetical protein
MRKILLLIIVLLFPENVFASNDWTDAIWSRVDGLVNLGSTDIDGPMRVTSRNYRPFVFTTQGTLEVYGTRDESITPFSSNTVYIESDITANDGGTTGTANTLYVQQQLNGSGGSETYAGVVQTALFSLRLGLAGASGMTYTIPSLYNVRMFTGSPDSASVTFDVTNDIVGLIIDDNMSTPTSTFAATRLINLHLGDYSGFSTAGTIPTHANLWIDPAAAGDTNNYGIVLDGDTSASGVTMGGDQDSTIFFNGNDTSYDEMLLNNIGTKSVCAIWSTIINPYMCQGWLNHSGTGNETDMVGGFVFALNNIAQSEVVVKSQVWTLNGAGGTEYLSRADDSSTFSFDGTTDIPFSGAFWVEVTDQAAAQTIIAKYGGAGTREWRFRFDSAEKLSLTLRDDSANANCIITSDAAVSTGWHFIGFTYDGSTEAAGGAMVLYVDGLSIAATGTVDCNGDGYLNMEDLAAPVTIGADAIPASYFLGDRGHSMLVRNDNLTADEMLKLYNSTKMFYGL